MTYLFIQNKNRRHSGGLNTHLARKSTQLLFFKKKNSGVFLPPLWFAYKCDNFREKYPFSGCEAVFLLYFFFFLLLLFLTETWDYGVGVGVLGGGGGGMSGGGLGGVCGVARHTLYV